MSLHAEDNMQGASKDELLQQPWTDKEAQANVAPMAGKPRRLVPNGRMASDPDGSVYQQFPPDQPSPPHTCAEAPPTSFPLAPPHVDEHTPYQPQGHLPQPALNTCSNFFQAVDTPCVPTTLHGHLASPVAAPPVQQHILSRQPAPHAVPVLTAHPSRLQNRPLPRQHKLELSSGLAWRGSGSGRDVGAAPGSKRHYVQSQVHVPGAPPASTPGSPSLHQLGRGAAPVQGPAGGPVQDAGLAAPGPCGRELRRTKRQRLQPVDGEGEQGPCLPGMEHLRDEQHPQRQACGQHVSSHRGPPCSSSPRADGAVERSVKGHTHGCSPPAAPPGTRSPGRLGLPGCKQAGGGWGEVPGHGMGPRSGAHGSAGGGGGQVLGPCARTAQAGQMLLLLCGHQPSAERGYELHSASDPEHCWGAGGRAGRAREVREVPTAILGDEHELQQQAAVLSQEAKQMQEQCQARSHAPQPPHRKRPELISMHMSGSQPQPRSQSHEGPSSSLRSGQQGHGWEQGLGAEGECRSAPQAQAGADGLLARPPRPQSHVPSGVGAVHGVHAAAPRRRHRVAASQSFSGGCGAWAEWAAGGLRSSETAWLWGSGVVCRECEGLAVLHTGRTQRVCTLWLRDVFALWC